MSDFRERLAVPYRERARRMSELKQRTEEAQRQGSAEIDAWPALIEHTGKETAAHFAARQGVLDEGMKPLELTVLARSKRRLKRLMRITWFTPRAFKVRMLNLSYRMGILVYRLLQLTLILAVLYAILRLIWFLA